MSVPTFFMRPCPTCGRRLEVQICYLGQSLSCPHCHSKFVATSFDDSEEDPTDVDRVLRDAERYLATVDEWASVSTAWERRETGGLTG